jgi:hypothetical protein
MFLRSRVVWRAPLAWHHHGRGHRCRSCSNLKARPNICCDLRRYLNWALEFLETLRLVSQERRHAGALGSGSAHPCVRPCSVRPRGPELSCGCRSRPGPFAARVQQWSDQEPADASVPSVAVLVMTNAPPHSWVSYFTTRIAWSSTYSLMPASPNSRPIPLCLTPPKGIRRSRDSNACELMNVLPASI